MKVIPDILQADQQLFLLLNGAHSPWQDVIMQAVTYKFTWIPLYILLLYGIVRTYKKQSIGLIISIVSVVALADQLASGFFKPYFMRPRPCHDALIDSLVHVVGNCGGAYGFISSHAATGFGIAAIVNLLPTQTLPGVRWLYLWALIYSYSRIYVGVHYPLDVAVGALVGVLAAWLVSCVYSFVVARWPSVTP